MSKSKKIALFLPRFKSSGGAEKQITLLAHGLAERGYDIHTLCLYAGGKHYDSLLQNSNIKTTVFIGDKSASFLKKALGFFMLPFKLRSYLKNNHIDICLAVLHVATFFACCVKILYPNFKLLLGVRTITPQKNTNIRFFFKGTKLLSGYADGLIANSSQALTYVRKQGFKPLKEDVILNGFNPEHFYFDKQKRQDVRHRYNISDTDIVLGYIGRLSAIKGIDLLIRAMADIIKTTPSTKLMIVGDGKSKYKDHLKQLVDNNALNNHVLFCGEQKEPLAFYSAFDLFVLPSKTESFPNVLAEALLCETPTIASDVGHNRELISEACLFKAGRVEMLIKTLQKNMPLDTQKRNVEGRKKILHNYSISSMIDGYENAFAQF